MALIASFGTEPTTPRQQAIDDLKKVDIELRRLPVEATAEEVLELVSSMVREGLGLAVSKKKK